MRIENRLIELKRFNTTEGIPDSFLSDVKNEIISRNRKRQDLINSISAFMILFVVGWGLYLKNLNVNDYDMSKIIIDLSEEVDSGSIFEQEDLSVLWESEGKETKRLFSYCINREDVENAILQGP